MIDTKFKVHGINKLLTFDELRKMPNIGKVGKVTVVDLKSQHNYKTGIVTIMRKFR